MAESSHQQAIEAAAGQKIHRSLSDRIFQLIIWTAVALAAVSIVITVVMFYTEFLDISREGASATGSLLKYVAVDLVLMTALTLAIAFFMKRYASRHIVEPIDQIASAATDYILDKSDGTLDETHFFDLQLDTDDELEHLALVLRDMEVSMVSYMDNLTRVTKEKERISTEMDLARRIQETMLPSVFPPYPDRRDLDIHASMDPAKEVGGDFYDFFLLDDNHLALVMADVSGKGIPAALFMMMARIMINSVTKAAGANVSPAEVLRQVNERICENNEAEMFITIWLGILELSTGKITACNAMPDTSIPCCALPTGNLSLRKIFTVLLWAEWKAFGLRITALRWSGAEPCFSIRTGFRKPTMQTASCSAPTASWRSSTEAPMPPLNSFWIT